MRGERGFFKDPFKLERKEGNPMNYVHQEDIITTLHAFYEAFDREEYLADLKRNLEEHSPSRQDQPPAPFFLLGDPESPGPGPHNE
jgi:hypothetical protein